MFYLVFYYLVLFYTMSSGAKKLLRQECDYYSLLTMWSQQFSLKKFGLSLIRLRLIQSFGTFHYNLNCNIVINVYDLMNALYFYCQIDALWWII